MIRYKFALLFFVFLMACKNDTPTPKTPEAEKTIAPEQPISAQKTEIKTNSKTDTVSVSSMEELVENAKSNSVIILEKGTYILEENMVYYMTKDERKIIDKKVVETRSIGGQLFFSGLNNFQIIGKNGAKIISKNPEAVVFFAIKGRDLKFSNLIIKKEIEGKTDLVYISNSQGIEIDRFKIGGGGTYGLNISNVDNMEVNNIQINKCTSGVLKVINSRIVSFKNSTFSDNFCTVPLVNLYGTGSIVSFNNVKIINNKKDPKSTFENSDRIFAVNGNAIKVDNCVIQDNAGYKSLGVGTNNISRSQIEGVNY